jgi:hypothetical protein
VTLGNPTLTSELKERLAAGITAETAGRGIAELWIRTIGPSGKENCAAAPFRQTFLNSSSAVIMRRIIIPLMRFGRLMRRAGLFDRYTP